MSDSLLNAEEQKAAAEAKSSGGLQPAGKYICRVFEVGRYEGGNSMLWKFKVAKGQPKAGHEFWDWTGLSADAIWKTKAHLTALGFGLDAGASAIEGTPCAVFVEIKARTDTGEPANKVVKIVAYDGPPLPEEDPVASDEDDIERDLGFADSDSGLI